MKVFSVGPIAAIFYTQEQQVDVILVASALI